MQHLQKLNELNGDVVKECLKHSDIPDSFPKKFFQAEATVVSTKVSLVASKLILPCLERGVEALMNVVVASVLLQCGDDPDKLKSMIGK